MGKKRAFLIVLILFIMAAVIVYPDRYLKSVADGFVLWQKSVLPALFPFFFFTKLLSGLGFPDGVGRLFSKPVKKVFHTPPVSAYIFFMSILCGYPVGAKLISDFYKNNVINTTESRKIIAFCSTSAPLFVIGTVGNYMLENQKAAVIILVSHYLSAVLTGLVFCNFKPLKDDNLRFLPSPKSADNLMAESLDSSVASILAVGASIAVFSLVIDIMSDLKIFNIFGEKNAPLLIGIVEMTRGCAAVSGGGFSTAVKIAAITAFISFGGLCVITQSMAFLSKTGIKTSYYFGVKIVQAAFGGLIGYALGLLLTG